MNHESKQPTCIFYLKDHEESNWEREYVIPMDMELAVIKQKYLCRLYLAKVIFQLLVCRMLNSDMFKNMHEVHDSPS